MKARSRGGSSSTSRTSTSTPSRRVASLRGAAAWVDRVGLATLFPVGDVVLPSLWQAVAGTLEVNWSIRDEQGAYVAFTPEMERCWRWKDELPAAGLACVGKHLGRWSSLLAPRLLPAALAVTGERRETLTPFQLEVADAVRAAGPCTGPQLRALVGEEKKVVDAAVAALQRALVLTNAGLVRQQQGWDAVAVDVLARRWPPGPVPSEHEARLELTRTVLASSGELSAADLGGALGWRLGRSRQTLEELCERDEARRRDHAGLALYRAT